MRQHCTAAADTLSQKSAYDVVTDELDINRGSEIQEQSFGLWDKGVYYFQVQQRVEALKLPIAHGVGVLAQDARALLLRRGHGREAPDLRHQRLIVTLGRVGSSTSARRKAFVSQILMLCISISIVSCRLKAEE